MPEEINSNTNALCHTYTVDGQITRLKHLIMWHCATAYTTFRPNNNSFSEEIIKFEQKLEPDYITCLQKLLYRQNETNNFITDKPITTIADQNRIDTENFKRVLDNEELINKIWYYLKPYDINPLPKS